MSTSTSRATGAGTGAAPALVVLAAGMARRYGGCKPLAPVGPTGEPIIDLLVSDAVAAGFSPIVLVLHPETGSAIRYHVETCWPKDVDVRFVTQRVPLGTVHAVLSARDAVPADRSFAVVNADDIYGEDALRMAKEHLDGSTSSPTPPGGPGRDAGKEHVLVAFRLGNTVLGSGAVTRGVCHVGSGGLLASVDERRKLARRPDGDFAAGDERDPSRLPPDTLVSVNLWGFRPAIWEVLAEAMSTSSVDESEAVARMQATGEAPAVEVLLPEVLGAMVADTSGGGSHSLPIRVLATDALCVGVTHPGDLTLVQAELARQVAHGRRPEKTWTREP